MGGFLEYIVEAVLQLMVLAIIIVATGLIIAAALGKLF